MSACKDCGLEIDWMYFSYDSRSLGTAFAYGDYEFSNFNPAGVWIK